MDEPIDDGGAAMSEPGIDWRLQAELDASVAQESKDQRARINELESIVRKRDNKIHKLQKKNKANRERLDKAVSLVRELSKLIDDGDNHSYQAHATLAGVKVFLDG